MEVDGAQRVEEGAEGGVALGREGEALCVVVCEG